MKGKQKLKLWLAFLLILMTVLIGYRIYLFVYESDYQAMNAENIERVDANLKGRSSYRFAVLGNIKNSMRIFERRILPLMHNSGADFMVSLGNAVYDGAEGKYRLLYRGLKKLEIPYLMAIGENETEDFGIYKFYRHFGPYFYSFQLENSAFIFLDTTGQTSWKWQLRWLQKELAAARTLSYRFVFLNRSVFPLPDVAPDETHFVLDPETGQQLQKLFSHYQVTAVFSAGYPTFNEQTRQGVRYIASGGGGGLLLDQEEPYQIATVDVKPDKVLVNNVITADRLGTLGAKFEILKLYLHSFFYMSLFNALLILSLIGLVALKLYSLILRQEGLYRDFSVDEGTLSSEPLRIAMFTNNYLPFIGGVPISIERLYRGLRQLGERVQIVAPTYGESWGGPEDGSVIRCPGLFNFHLGGFPVANVFSRQINRAFRSLDCDVVHVHHPFWIGKKGLQLAKRHGLPVIFTYHTRLERYTHYFPVPGKALKNLVAHILIKRFANRCDAIITPTPSTEEYLRHLGVSALIETLPTGISMDSYKCWTALQINALRQRNVADNEALLISVSRMAREKNLDFLIDGLHKVSELSPQFKCLLVGDGPEKGRLEEKVRTLGLAERILFTGNLPPNEVAGHYLAADLFVFASTSETQGMVLVEAMAGGCPVVAVRASGVYDVIRNGYNGFMVTESTENWAQTVAQLLTHPDRLSALSDNSRAFADNYSEEKIAKQAQALYRRMVILGQAKRS